jgi:hypothetical protein
MITDNQYLSTQAESQSRLKKILKHPYFYLNNQHSDDDEPSEVTLIGDGVDFLLTQNEDVFNDNFVVATVERPTAQMGDYVWELYANRNNENPEQIAYDKVGFKRDSIEKVQERFKTEGLAYYNQLLESETKKLISVTQYNAVLSIVESLKTHPFTQHIFNRDSKTKLSQVPLYGKWNDFNMKGLLDLIIYDSSANTIYPIDIKTTSKSLHFFEDTIFDYRYDFQAAFYMELIYQNTGLLMNEFNITEHPVIAPFSFIVESQKFQGAPLIFQMSKDALNIGKFGGIRKNRNYEGFTQAFDRLSYHLETDLWEYRKEDYISKGVRIVN